MSQSPYSRFTQAELILRDLLAIDRTVLANERTFLAYLRTAFALFIAGVTFIKLPIFESHVVVIIGWICLPLGVLAMIVGFWRYRKVKKDIDHVRQKM